MSELISGIRLVEKHVFLLKNNKINEYRSVKSTTSMLELSEYFKDSGKPKSSNYGLRREIADWMATGLSAQR